MSEGPDLRGLCQVGARASQKGPLLPGSANPGLSGVERDFDVRFSDI